MADVTFEQIRELIEQMSPTELERLRTYLKTVIEGEQPENRLDKISTASGNKGTWGQQLVALVQQFNLGEADQWQTDDPEEWVCEYRRTQASKRNEGWGTN